MHPEAAVGSLPLRQPADAMLVVDVQRGSLAEAGIAGHDSVAFAPQKASCDSGSGAFQEVAFEDFLSPEPIECDQCPKGGSGQPAGSSGEA